MSVKILQSKNVSQTLHFYTHLIGEMNTVHLLGTAKTNFHVRPS
jgi:hypothetical protein